MCIDLMVDLIDLMDLIDVFDFYEKNHDFFPTVWHFIVATCNHKVLFT